MAYYNTCSNCGSNLDPGETCDCQHNASDCAQIGHIETCKNTAKIVCDLMDEFERTDPPEYVALISMLGSIMTKGREFFSYENIRYPEEVFLAAIDRLTVYRETPYSPDIPRSYFDNAIALIRSTWLNAA